jgi:hypothetical protein
MIKLEDIRAEVITDNFVIEPESQEAIMRLHKRFPFCYRQAYSVFVDLACLYINFSIKAQIFNSKYFKEIKHEGYPTGDL